MSQILTYPSFLRTQGGGFVQTNDVLIDRALRRRLTPKERRSFDRIADRMSPDRLRRLAARRAGGAPETPPAA